MDKQQLNFIPAERAVRSAVAIVDRIQDLPAAEQVAAISVAFVLYAEQTGICPSELINKAQRITADNDTFFQREVKALRDYVRNEVR